MTYKSYKEFLTENKNYVLKSLDPIREIIPIIQKNADVKNDIVRIQATSSKRCCIFVKPNVHRVTVLKKLIEYFKKNGYPRAIHDGTKSSPSTVGIGILSKNLSFYVKYDGQQNVGAAGITNEHTLINSINEAVNGALDGINIKFIDSHGKEFEMFNVIEAKAVGTLMKSKDTNDELEKGVKKADVKIITKNSGSYLFSIKKNDAERWESADKYASPIVKPILDREIAAAKEQGIAFFDETTTIGEINKKEYKLKKFAGYTQLGFCVECTPEEMKMFCFGNDIKPGTGAIITANFEAMDPVLRLESNGSDITDTYVCKVLSIWEKLSDIPKDKLPIIYIRNSSGRNNPVLGYPGLRVEARYKKSVKNAPIFQRI